MFTYRLDKTTDTLTCRVCGPLNFLPTAQAVQAAMESRDADTARQVLFVIEDTAAARSMMRLHALLLLARRWIAQHGAQRFALVTPSTLNRSPITETLVALSLQRVIPFTSETEAMAWLTNDSEMENSVAERDYFVAPR